MSYLRILREVEHAVATRRVTLLGVQLASLLRKYDPNQPRVPAGRPDGGQWTRVAGIGGIAGGKWDNGNWEKCEEQYDKDFRLCPPGQFACREQAMLRMVNCMKNEPLAPFRW